VTQQGVRGDVQSSRHGSGPAKGPLEGAEDELTNSSLRDALMSMITTLPRDQLQTRVLRTGPGREDDNLEHIYGESVAQHAGKMISLATETERTLFFDFLPVDLGTIRGFQNAIPPLHRPRPGVLQRQPEAHLKGVTASSSSPIAKSSAWKQTSSRCRICTTTCRSTGTT